MSQMSLEVKWSKSTPNKDGWWLVYYIKRKVVMVGFFKKGKDGKMYICNEDYEPQVIISELLSRQEVLFGGSISLPQRSLQ